PRRRESDERQGAERRPRTLPFQSARERACPPVFPSGAGTYARKPPRRQSGTLPKRIPGRISRISLEVVFPGLRLRPITDEGQREPFAIVRFHHQDHPKHHQAQSDEGRKKRKEEKAAKENAVDRRDHHPRQREKDRLPGVQASPVAATTAVASRSGICGRASASS